MTWRDIPGWEGYYQISENGYVRSLSRTVVRTDGTEVKVKERILKWIDSNGCKSVTLRTCSEQCKRTVWHLLALTFHGHPSPGHFVEVIGPEFSPDNVRWSYDPFAKDWRDFASRKRRAVSAEEAATIRTINASNSQIAKAFGTTVGVVSRIKLFRQYRGQF